MADGSHIQWTDATWNTVTGCTRISEGCRLCYIDRQPPFRMTGRRFDSPKIGGTTGLLFHEDRFTLPLRWREPRNVFVNSLSDLFHADVPDEHIAAVFAAMALARQHTFQILTKRPARMRALLTSYAFRLMCEDAEARIVNDEASPIPQYKRRAWLKAWWSSFAEPLPNVHLGVSVESQKWADIRIRDLARTPAAVRFLSVEPLHEPVNLGLGHRADSGHDTDLLDSWNRVCLDCSVSPADYVPSLEVPYFEYDEREPLPVDWIIVGGESGKDAAPCNLEWIGSVISQGRAAGVPVFVKQLGSAWAREHRAKHPKGGDPAEWPEQLRVREPAPKRTFAARVREAAVAAR